jgi:hypothetical protein
VELLGSIHYIPDLSQSQAGQKSDTHSYKKLLYKIGVAGFVFMNVMTYSLPHYFPWETYGRQAEQCTEHTELYPHHPRCGVQRQRLHHFSG